MKCIVCEKPINEDQHVCSKECETQWDAEEAERKAEIEWEDAERLGDHNEGCWSYNW